MGIFSRDREESDSWSLHWAEQRRDADANKIRELEAALCKQWQPINTAPMDGTPILVVNGDDGGYHTEPYQVGTAAWTERDGLGRPNWISTACCDNVSRYLPTHWMPLPEPPK